MMYTVITLKVDDAVDKPALGPFEERKEEIEGLDGWFDDGSTPPDDGPNYYQFSSNSKYQIDGAHEYLIDITRQNPKVTAILVEDWQGHEEPGRTEYVYQGGRLVPGRSTQTVEVKQTLGGIASAAHAALKALEAAAEGDSNDAEIDAGQEVADQLKALLSAVGYPVEGDE